MVIFCGTVSAQTPTPQTITEDVRLVETLSEGRGYIFKIGEQEIRGVPADRWRELLVAEVTAKSAAEQIKLLEQQKGFLINLIASLEKRGDVDAQHVATLTQMLNECQAQLAARGKQTKLGFVKELAGAGWQIFTWWRAFR